MTPAEAKHEFKQTELRIRAESERDLILEQLNETRKLADAGRDSLTLAMDVVHILQSVQGYAEIIAPLVTSEPRATRYVDDLRGVAERGMAKLREFVARVKLEADVPVIRQS
ncbi:hypothetical protein [Zavarzinella formosa]|uniref:hypothetical protein n=1 Tax=Zavarzinella formosa TaxID=360055 RepID=UPI00031D26B2|nr:hypothetical protein [Zavarzinella formosa]